AEEQPPAEAPTSTAPAEPTEESTAASEAKPEEQQPVPEESAEASQAPPEPTPAPVYKDDYADSDNAAVDDLVPEKKPSPFMLGLLWDMSLPVGITHDFVGKFSGRGFAVDGRYSGFGNIGLGVTLAWHILDQKTETTTTWDAVTISGTQVREISSSPFTAKVFYALRDQEKFIPYAGIGMGAARVVRRIDMGIASLTDESWHFAFVPELGVEVPFKAATLLASTRFNYFVKNNDGPAQLYMNFSLGVGFN